MRYVIDIDDFSLIFTQAALFFGIYLLFFKRYIYSLLDPLFIYVFTLSFSSVLVVNTLGVTQGEFAVHFFLCHSFFFLGFALTSYKFQVSKTTPTILSSSFPDYYIFRIILYLLLALYFFANMALFYTTGFALLADDPSRAKVENPEIGFAILTQINIGVGSFLFTGLIFLLFSKPKYSDVVLLIIVIFLSSLSGAKGALIYIAVIIGFITNQPLFKQNNKIRLIIRFITPIVLLLAASLPFLIYRKEVGGLEESLINYVTRLLMGADSTLYFYQPVNEQYFAQYHFWDYPAYLFNGILSFLRIVPGIEANGNVMIRNIINNYNAIVAGPNTPYYIEGQIYFGYYGAFIYSAFVGTIYAYSRYNFFNKQFSSAFSFVLTACIANHLSAIPMELTFGVFCAFLTCFFTLPVYFFVNFILRSKVKWKVKKSNFSINWLRSRKTN
ncbi:oligosaccharide repeat unit polymerase [Spirosoma endophyticum]|uniref:Oligosaccharide repeat unit polymerase n=1 Tax=Spirosoma endophyticum TaxID=662367 RepID=A0A1I1TA37_9BACT|nr:oligosaccharide repeat unit polymerase [Spirosoma endophyticum]SFD55494.1 hypothetical protein SAMN05216167_105399 [Spirosoma endophyticum]